MNSPAVPEPGRMRASDADRERIAEILRQAAGDGRLTLEELDQRLDAVYAAKTYADLEPVTQDLPKGASPLFESPPGRLLAPQTPSGGPAVPREGSSAPRFGGQPGTAVAVAILGGSARKGEWVVPKNFGAFALLGSTEIDMREARFEEQSVTLQAVAILGAVEITVPADATVHVNGIGILGSFEHAPDNDGTPDGPVITINGLALLGSVEVKRKRPKKARRERETRELD